jgi:hypothetical protein
VVARLGGQVDFRRGGLVAQLAGITFGHLDVHADPRGADRAQAAAVLVAGQHGNRVPSAGQGQHDGCGG